MVFTSTRPFAGNNFNFVITSLKSGMVYSLIRNHFWSPNNISTYSIPNPTTSPYLFHLLIMNMRRTSSVSLHKTLCCLQKDILLLLLIHLPPYKRSHIPPPSLESDSDSSTPNHFSWLQSPSPFCQTYFMLLQTNTLCMTHLQGTTLTSTMMLMLLMYPTFPFIVLTSLYGHRKQVSQIVLVNLKEGPMNRGLIRPPYEYCLLMSSDIILDTYISDCIYSFLEWKYVR